MSLLGIAAFPVIGENRAYAAAAGAASALLHRAFNDVLMMALGAVAAWLVRTRHRHARSAGAA